MRLQSMCVCAALLAYPPKFPPWEEYSISSVLHSKVHAQRTVIKPTPSAYFVADTDYPSPLASGSGTYERPVFFLT